MSKPAIQTTQNLKAPNSAIPAQSSQSQSRVSSWAKGPPSFDSSAAAAAAATSSGPTPVRSGSNGPGSRMSHSRRPSTLGPGAAVAKDSVTMPRNVPGSQAAAPLHFGSIGDADVTLSSSPANAPPISENLSIQKFGSIRAEPPPLSTTSAPAKPAPAPAVADKAAASGAKPKRKFDVQSLFQTTSTSGPSNTTSPTTTAVPSPSMSSAFTRGGTASPSMSPAQRYHNLPPSGNYGNGQQRGPTSSVPRSPNIQRQSLNGQQQNGPPGGRPQPNGNGHAGPSNGLPHQHQQQQPNGGPMNSPRMAPNQLSPQSPPPQQQFYYPGPMGAPQGMPYYAPQYYGYPPDYTNQQWPMYQMPSPMPSAMPLGPQGMPPPHLPPHASSPSPISNSPRNAHLPPPPMPPSSLPAIPPPQTPRGSNRPIPPPSGSSNGPSLKPSAAEFTPRAASRPSKITLTTLDGSPIDLPSVKTPTSIVGHQRQPSITPTYIRAPSVSVPEVVESPKITKRVSAPIRIESAEDRDKRLAAEAEVKRKEEEAKAKKEAEEKATIEKAAAEEKARIEAAAAAERAKAEAEAEAERIRVLKEKEEAEAKEAERQRILAEEAAAREAEAKAEAEALAAEAQRIKEEEAAKALAVAEADKAREADVAAAAAKAEAARAEAERLTREAATTPVTPANDPAVASTAALSEDVPAVDVVKPLLNTLGLSSRKPFPGHLDLSSAIAKSNMPAPPSALASARLIEDIDKVHYPDGIQSPNPDLNKNAPKGKFRYDRDFLLQFMKTCDEKPDSLPDLDMMGISKESGVAQTPGGSGRSQRTRNLGSMPPPSRTASGVQTPFGGGKSGFGGMGNFTSAGAGKTNSNDRFLASQMQRSTSISGGNFAGGPIGRGGVVPMSRSASQGGVGGVPPSPKDGLHGTSRTRSQRGNRRPDKGPTPGQHFNSPSISNAQLEPVAPLEKSENRWTAGSIGAPSQSVVNDNPANVDAPAVVERKVKALLNKLTMEKFDNLSDQIIQWANKSEQENDGATLILVIKLVFEKATDEAAWSEMYARLCRKMMELVSQNVQDDSVKNSTGQHIVGGLLFRKYLLNRCQEDFERGWAFRESTAAAAADKAADDQARVAAQEKSGDGETVLYSDEYYAAEKAKRRGLGLVKFIGELFKLQMLTERIMHECIKKLLSNIENPEEEDIESLCRLLTTVGRELDTQKAREHMSVYFSRMQELAGGSSISSRIKYMILDVIEMRHRKWQQRSAVAAPQTIAQVHAEAAKDTTNKERESYARQSSISMSRNGSRRGGQRGDEAQDGWNTVPVPSVSRVAGNLGNFGKLGKAGTAPSSNANPFQTFQKGAKPANTPPLSRASSTRDMSAANSFAMLNEAPADLPPTASSSRAPSRKPSLDLGVGGVPDASGGRRKLVLAPRSKQSPFGTDPDAAPEMDDGTDEVAGSSADKAELIMTAEQADTRIAEDIKEFWNGRNVDEARHYFEALPDDHRHRLVSKMANSALDKKETDVILVSDVFAKVAGDLVSEAAFEEGLLPTVEIVDDLSVDVPKAYAFVARLLYGSKLSRAKVEDLGSKIMVDGDPLISPSQKLLKEYQKLLT